MDIFLSFHEFASVSHITHVLIFPPPFLLNSAPNSMPILSTLVGSKLTKFWGLSFVILDSVFSTCVPSSINFQVVTSILSRDCPNSEIDSEILFAIFGKTRKLQNFFLPLMLEKHISRLIINCLLVWLRFENIDESKTLTIKCLAFR